MHRNLKISLPVLPVNSRNREIKRVFILVNGDLASFLHYLPDAQVNTGRGGEESYIVTAVVAKEDKVDEQREVR